MNLRKKSKNVGISNDLSTLATLAGIGSSAKGNTALFMERLKGREFILNVSKELSLEKDTFYNTYSSPTIEPFWKSSIKNFFGIESTQFDEQSLTESSIISNFLTNVVIKPTKAGIYRLK